jgi:hypothetical protein
VEAVYILRISGKCTLIDTLYFEGALMLLSTATQTYFLEHHVIFAASKYASYNHRKSQSNLTSMEYVSSSVQ